MQLLGQIASLGAALCWAVGLNLFRRDVREVGAHAVNLFKGMLGTALFLVALLVLGLPRVPVEAQLALILSGILGFALGDTCLFLTLGEMGPHRAALFGGLGPVFTAVGGWLLLDESLALPQVAGIAAAAGGVAMVVYFRRGRDHGSSTARGVFFGLLAALCQAGGVLLTKRGLAEADALAGSALRLAAATAVLAVASLSRRRLGADLGRLFRGATLRRLVPAALVGTFAGIWLMQVGIEHTESAVASALHSTTPLFTLPIAVFVVGERVGLLAVLGSFLAVGGVALIFLA